MPDRPLTIATYAAGASLAAITLVYVFGPTFFFDHDAAHSSRASRKKGIVGLVNPANDCFINSILQALAGLPELRAYLIREVHRRKLDGPAAYSDLSAAQEERRQGQTGTKPVSESAQISLQQGLVTAGLKEMLDALNERPLYKKTISAQAFIRGVERAFSTRISRSQQDAQEFLQVIVQRLAEEHSAGRKVRRRLRLQEGGVLPDGQEIELAAERVPQVTAPAAQPFEAGDGSSRNGSVAAADVHIDQRAPSAAHDGTEADEDSFPMEGKLESQVECSVCHFKPKPSVSSFLTLTLNVPNTGSSTTLNACFDGIFRIEHIEDFRCDRCRLEHALQLNERQLARAAPASSEHAKLAADRRKLETALRDDPETPPKDVPLPPLAAAPARHITRHTRVSAFPPLLVVHLSRSIWDAHAASAKNMAKVAFPETLPLGGLLQRQTYRLLSVVTHKGGHHSGHYESFRRQRLAPPFSTPASLGTGGIYSLRGSPVPSAGSSPQLRSASVGAAPDDSLSVAGAGAGAAGTPDSSLTPSSSAPSLDSASGARDARLDPVSVSAPLPPAADQPATRARPKAVPTPPFDAIPTPGLPDLPGAGGAASATAAAESMPPQRMASLKSLGRSPSQRYHLQRRKQQQQQQQQDRWWRISDEKVKECKTSEVLGMQREVYLLFYEMLPGGAPA